MDMNAVTSLIGTLGFPIVMTLLLFFYVKEQNELHDKEINSLKEAINDLKLAIITLTERLMGNKKNEN